MGVSRLTKKQKEFLKILETTYGNTAAAIKKTGYSRFYYEKWKAESQAFRIALYNIQENKKDFYEAQANMHIANGDTGVLKLALTSQCKDRGWGESSSIEISKKPTDLTQLSDEELIKLRQKLSKQNKEDTNENY